MTVTELRGYLELLEKEGKGGEEVAATRLLDPIGRLFPITAANGNTPPLLVVEDIEGFTNEEWEDLMGAGF